MINRDTTVAMPIAWGTRYVVKSTDESIATVSEFGVVSGVGEGTTTIVVTDNETNKSINLTLTVQKRKDSIKSVKVSTDGYVLEITFDKPISLYVGIENDFFIIKLDLIKADEQYKVEKVMIKDGDPNTLVLIMETPVPNENISVQFKDDLAFELVTKIENVSVSTVTLYPIPMNNSLTIEGEDLLSIEIISLDGKVLANEQLSGNKSEITLPMLSVGTFIAKVETAKGVQSFLIEKK
ncbi:MAG: T9SS type A sorting domain-containing protein [Bacteroidales bacterium]|nr:T9SS type A sorting domain-containing protein [Bacteroidales bacterium]